MEPEIPLYKALLLIIEDEGGEIDL